MDPAFRGSGRGDSLLDYVEQDARVRGVTRLVLLTTRTADWFEQRDFKWSGGDCVRARCSGLVLVGGAGAVGVQGGKPALGGGLFVSPVGKTSQAGQAQELVPVSVSFAGSGCMGKAVLCVLL